MKNGAFTIFIVILVALDLLLHVGLGYSVGTPDLITAAALLAARRMSGVRASLLGLFLGLLADSLSLVSFGASGIALVCVCFLGARTRDMFEGNSALFIAFYLFLGKWLRDIIWYFAALGQSGDGAPTSTLYTNAPVAALITGVAGAVAYMIYRAVVGERRFR